ncbi:hypothetical protein J6590_107020, partial [Homalodisca vitripennis]
TSLQHFRISSYFLDCITDYRYLSSHHLLHSTFPSSVRIVTSLNEAGQTGPPPHSLSLHPHSRSAAVLA